MKKIIIPILTAAVVATPCITLAACNKVSPTSDGELLITGGNESIKAVAGLSGKDTSSLYSAIHKKTITKPIDVTYKVIHEYTDTEISGFSVSKEDTESYVQWTAEIAKDNTNFKYRIKATGTYEGKTYTAYTNVKSITFSTAGALTVSGPTKHIEAYTKDGGWDNNPLSTKLNGQEVSNVTYSIISSTSGTSLSGFSIKEISGKRYVAWDASISPSPGLITYRVKAVYSNDNEMYSAISEIYEIQFSDQIILAISGGYTEIYPNYGIAGQDIDDLNLTLGGKPVTPNDNTFSIIGETDSDPAPSGIGIIFYANDYYVNWTSDAVKTDQTIKYRVKAVYVDKGTTYTAKTGVRSITPKKGELTCSHLDSADCISGIESECGNVTVKYKDAFAQVTNVTVDPKTTYSIEGDDAVKRCFSIVKKGTISVLKFNDKGKEKSLGNFNIVIAVKYITKGGAELTYRSTPINAHITQQPYFNVEGLNDTYEAELSSDSVNRIEMPNFKATFYDKDGNASDISTKVQAADVDPFSFSKKDNKYFYISWVDGIEAKVYTPTFIFVYATEDNRYFFCHKTVTFSFTGKELNYAIGTDVESGVAIDSKTPKPRYHTPWNAKLNWPDQDITHVNNVTPYVNRSMLPEEHYRWNKQTNILNIPWQYVIGDITVNHVHFNYALYIKDPENVECSYTYDKSTGKYKTNANSQQLQLFDAVTKQEITSTQERPITWSLASGDDRWEIENKNNKFYLKLKEGWLQSETFKDICNRNISIDVQAKILDVTAVTKKITYYSYIYDFNPVWGEGFRSLTRIGHSHEKKCMGSAESAPLDVKIFGDPKPFENAAIMGHRISVSWEEAEQNNVIKLPKQIEAKAMVTVQHDPDGKIRVHYPDQLLWVCVTKGFWEYKDINDIDWSQIVGRAKNFQPTFTININIYQNGLDHIYSHSCQIIVV